MALDYQEILEYNVAAPRYTSYPPANLFVEEAEPARVIQALQASNHSETTNLSFYFHIPFCPKRCLFCGCQTEIGVGGREKQRYFRSLFSEMERVLPLLDSGRKVTQVHFGGGTPNAVPFKYLREILDRLRERFVFEDYAEIAIECDPALLSKGKVAELGEMGFNRISLGVQDLEEKVLQTVDRDPSRIPLKELVEYCREVGMKSVNLDLIYGLPYQNRESFQQTVQKVIDIHPDRVATFAYAHIPWVKGQQNQLPVDQMPNGLQRLVILEDTVDLFVAAGYEWIGMDHFALPNDNLAIAKKEGSLKRNFQGYCTQQHTGQVIAFGASAIGQLDGAFYQNVRTAKEYSDAMESKELPVYRFYPLNIAEKYIGDVIAQVLCNGRIDWDLADQYEIAHDERLENRFAENIAKLESKGLVYTEGNSLRLTAKGLWVVRYVAMHLDPLFEKPMGSNPYSKAV